MNTSAPQTIHVRAAAKVNLTLAVLGKRPDGFHDLESWVVQIGLFDDLRLSNAERLSLTLREQQPTASTGLAAPNSPASGRSDSLNSIPSDATNLACRAAIALADAASREPTVHMELLKAIPVGAGLGGGSSDAAATLRGLNEFWGLRWPVERLMPIAEQVGSDVPLFLQPTGIVIRGRGERLEAAPVRWQGWIALIRPPFGISTADVFRSWSTVRGPRRPSTGMALRLAEIWPKITGDSRHWSSVLFNDLEPPAFAIEPRLARLHAALDGLEGRPVRMTGSGSCLFALFDAESDARSWQQCAVGQVGTETSIEVVRTL